ncbi:hypothetical protein HPB47_004608 [Ixodes persulcatus]|uniref:Uncharacterized protein n=1 Tax=Ixodes persulcatus TaxID=34615 RepID=A0AC60PFB8_IXOPE|nr:hypothetical protein HPB47_004608 [Ixodes persulcatus]
MAVTTAAALAAKHKRDKFLVDLVRLGVAAPARRDSADVQPVQRRVDGARSAEMMEDPIREDSSAEAVGARQTSVGLPKRNVAPRRGLRRRVRAAAACLWRPRIHLSRLTRDCSYAKDATDAHKEDDRECGSAGGASAGRSLFDARRMETDLPALLALLSPPSNEPLQGAGDVLG